MKKFNVTGKCYPNKHYMVDISDRLEQIKQMVDDGDYFCINKGRQYGKTTTLSLLKKRLENQYTVFSISFEGLGKTPFQTEDNLAVAFLTLLKDSLDYNEVKNVSSSMEILIREHAEHRENAVSFASLSRIISKICQASSHPIILLIDEVDQAGNYTTFLDFLGLLRDQYLKREERPTFQSVILAGVYDIKNLKLKIRPEGEHQYNSPWNIAAEFNVAMDFSKEDIAGMLTDYETDHRISMDVAELSQMIYDYTAGYPFLVSRLCKIMDEKLPGTKPFPDKKAAWSRDGFLQAVKELLTESNTLFDDMRKKLAEYPELHEILYELLYEGTSFPYNAYMTAMNIANMFGYIRNAQGRVMVANRIFETWLYNLFLAEEQLQSAIYSEGSKERSLFVQNGKLDMKKVLERFVVHFTELYGNMDEKFVEKAGRKFFLFYLKPIINGAGNYYVEAETRDEGKTDVVVDYLGEQFVVELKIWRGNAYNKRGEQQLVRYLDSLHLDRGYLLSFNFNQKKEIGVKEIAIGDKVLVEAVV